MTQGTEPIEKIKTEPQKIKESYGAKKKKGLKDNRGLQLLYGGKSRQQRRRFLEDD